MDMEKDKDTYMGTDMDMEIFRAWTQISTWTACMEMALHYEPKRDMCHYEESAFLCSSVWAIA
jgi:hypothetical protein